MTITGIASRAFRNLSRRKTRALLVVIALSFCIAILIAVPAGIGANQNAANNLVGNLGNTITQTEATINKSSTQIQCSLTPSAPTGFGISSSGPVTSAGGSGSGPSPVVSIALGMEPLKPMNESLYSDINTTLSGVAAVEPMLQVVEGHNETITPHGQVVTSGGPGAPPPPQNLTVLVPYYIITGVPLNASLIDNYPILPTNIVQGRNLQPSDANTNNVVISENVSAYFHAGVGDTINILGKDFNVVGIYSPTGTSDKQLVYMDLQVAQALTNNTGIITALNVFATNKDVVTSLANTISSLHPELVVTTAQDILNQLQQMESTYDAQLANAQATMNRTRTQAFEEIVIAVAATSIIVLFVMLYTVRERTKEIGTLKARGFSNWNVMSQFMLEGVSLSLIAGVVGIAIAIVAAPALSSLLLPRVNPFGFGNGAVIYSSAASNLSAATVSPQLMLVAFGATALLGALGSLYPAWRASRTSPIEALRYE